jgi:hypothetical protein
MVDSESPEEKGAGSGESQYPVAPDSVRNAIEQALVGEVVRRPETALSFSRIFNRDPDFSRIFSRGGSHLEELKMQDLAKMDDADFARFTERLRSLQDMASSEQREGR